MMKTLAAIVVVLLILPGCKWLESRDTKMMELFRISFTAGVQCGIARTVEYMEQPDPAQADKIEANCLERFDSVFGEKEGK